MASNESIMLLKIYHGERDTHQGHPLFEAVVLRARAQGLRGATVTRGIMGFGSHSQIHTSRILRLSDDLPIVIEIVDSREKIEAFLKDINDMLGWATVVTLPVERAAHLTGDPSPSAGS